MTYIVALKAGDTNALIADTRVSWWADGRRKGENIQLKIGLFFPGCIFGIVGDVIEARKFIVSFRESITSESDDLWARFAHHADAYPAPENGRSFTLVLSSRWDGSPRLKLFRPGQGLSDIHDVPRLQTFGSGKAILDVVVLKTFESRLDDALRRFGRGPHYSESTVRRIWPYFMCLWLNEMSLTFEASELARHDVGGVFHFIWQSSQYDQPQAPALHLMCAVDRERRKRYVWSYRTVAVEEGLFVERHEPPHDDGPEHFSREFFVDSAARSDVAAYTLDELAEIVERSLRELPFWVFVGYGSTDPSQRDKMAFQYFPKGGPKSDFFEKDGSPTLWAQRALEYFQDGPPEGLDWQPVDSSIESRSLRKK